VATWIAAFIIANVIPFFSSRKQPSSLTSSKHCANRGLVLSLMSSLFDSFFGFIFWGVAYFRMRKADGSVALLHDRSFRGWFEGILNIVSILPRRQVHLQKQCFDHCTGLGTSRAGFPVVVLLQSRRLTFQQLIILAGIFILTVGTYASVEGIIEEFEAGDVGSVFQCASNGI
jgi:hypothetical protein